MVHWFHLLQDGRTGFVGRTHASDNLLWLAWGVVEYVGGDRRRFAPRRADAATWKSELPFEPLPAGKHGMGFDPLRSSREDTVYRHCLKAIDLVLDRRMGAHGLPLDRDGRLERRARRDRQPGAGRERLARLLPLLHPGADGRRSWARRKARRADPLPRRGSRRYRTPWSGPGGTTATCGPSTTTAPRSASRGAASGRSTP